MLLLLLMLALAAYINAENRIVGGAKTTIEKFPYQVSLEYSHSTFCGGAIISPNHILTAAHCVRMGNIKQANIRVGSTTSLQGGQVYKALNVTFPPGFVDGSGYKPTINDAIVITLTEPIHFGSSVQPISIVPVDEEPKHGEMLNVAGWGYTSYNYEQVDNDLRMVRLVCIKREMCADVYTNLKYNVTTSMICAGGRSDKKGTFKGDSGGPLVNSKKQLVGVVSWGRPDNSPGYPRVFTNIADVTLNKFIREMIDS